ncbi:MAG: ATP phosphoribosyltransferase [Alphaproteobacteria bacterium]|nr:ATP phosphoribosyltransferase [Alphaproteobacteria bacterium]
MTHPLRLALPKGRMQAGVFTLLAEAGAPVRVSARGYRPTVSLDGVEAKLLKPQNTIEMLAAGSRDLGFAGADWVAELGVELVELLDTSLDPVRLVAAAPEKLVASGWPPDRPLVVASEYERLTRSWIAAQGLNAHFVRSYGATEVFPPEDADCIVDNTATGATLVANNLEIVDTLMRSSTRLYANPRALEDATRRGLIEDLVLLLRSVLEARRRVMLEVNVEAALLEAVVDGLPCMREPTISLLHGDAGYAVKAAVPREMLPTLIPSLRARGGTDIVVTALAQIVP